MTHYRKLLQSAGDNLMSMIAEAGGESSNYFTDLFSPHPMHTFRTILYPKRGDNIPEGAYLEDGRSNITIFSTNFIT